MAALREHAVGTDDVGPVAAADIEESTALHLFATVPPPAPALAAELLLGLEPTQALALCESSPFYQEICDSDGFKERYQDKWHVKVRVAGPAAIAWVAGPTTAFKREYSLFGTRNIADVKGIYEREFGLERTGYTLFNAGAISGRPFVPTAQSSLGGMVTDVSGDAAHPFIEITLQAIPRALGTQLDRELMHWFANGDKIELSE